MDAESDDSRRSLYTEDLDEYEDHERPDYDMFGLDEEDDEFQYIVRLTLLLSVVLTQCY